MLWPHQASCTRSGNRPAVDSTTALPQSWHTLLCSLNYLASYRKIHLVRRRQVGANEIQIAKLGLPKSALSIEKLKQGSRSVLVGKRHGVPYVLRLPQISLLVRAQLLESALQGGVCRIDVA